MWKGILRPDFVWGVSTSSYQVEGAVAEDGRGPSVWDTRCRLKDCVANGDTGDVACDHYHRYAEDVRLMQDIGVGAYRFSVAWPRVLPLGRGPLNQPGLDFYDRLVDSLLAAGIEPWMCLFHSDLPQALDDLGGWTNRDSAGWFADYAALVARRYGDRVKRFATVNEPSVFILFDYVFSSSAARSDRAAHLRAIHHINLSHGAAVDVLRDLVPGAKVGAIHNWQRVLPSDAAEDTGRAAVLMDEHWNLVFADPQLLACYPPQVARAVEPFVQAGDMARICRPVDWFGMNHYAPVYARVDANAPWGFNFGALPEGMPVSDIGWPMLPAAFRDALIDLTRRYRLPIFVTENGFGSHDAPDDQGRIVDQRRIDYLAAYTAAMVDAAVAGADVRGYFVWSLLDNFEWGAGYANRFGLVYVDFATQQRVPKASAGWFARLIRNGAG
jgi:beta-glucosidase